MPYKKGNIPWTTGRKHTEESKEKMRQGTLKRWKLGLANGFQKGNQFGKNTAGENHGNWRGGYKMYRFSNRKTGYRWIRIGVRKYQAEHRYVMEQHMGRKLTKKEAVHHIDSNGLNNAMENLQVVSWAEHKNLHKGSYKHLNFKCLCGIEKHFAKGKCKKCYDREYHKTYKIK